jgi:hypothetical protein
MWWAIRLTQEKARRSSGMDGERREEEEKRNVRREILEETDSGDED